MLATAILGIKVLYGEKPAEQGSFASTLDKLPPLEPDAPKAEEHPVKAVEVLQLVQPNGLWLLFDEKTMKTAEPQDRHDMAHCLCERRAATGTAGRARPRPRSTDLRCATSTRRARTVSAQAAAGGETASASAPDEIFGSHRS